MDKDRFKKEVATTNIYSIADVKELICDNCQGIHLNCDCRSKWECVFDAFIEEIDRLRLENRRLMEFASSVRCEYD